MSKIQKPSRGTRIGHYEIQSPLGAGGMGEVYKAHDHKLERTVAIKVLAAQDDEASARLLQEARSASALNHPHICTIYEVGEHEGQAFIVMEHVAGKPLNQLIPSDGLPPESVIRYGVQIADALAHAHERSIVHRDLKSANVVITHEGQAKVLDFGLATRLAQSDAEAVTKTWEAAGMIVGTLAYMAPEVLRGEAATARSDIWALGVLLYEMASGRLPFEGTSAADLSAAILRESPNAYGDQVSAGLRAITERALAKESGQRYGTAGEVRAALEAHQSSRSVEVASTPTSSLSIAVLPFSNLSSDPEQDYFSDGLTEEVTSDLSKVRALRVISSTSARRMKGTDKDLETIGRELKVRYLLEGSVRKAGSNLRITAQLIDVADDVHLWSEKYSGSLEDVFDIQERVSREIVEALQIELTPDDERRVSERPIQDVQAYEYYLRARNEMYRGDEESMRRAVELIQNALSIVGENALLYSALGMAYWHYVNMGYSSDRRYDLERAEECARKVFQLEPESAPGYVLRGMIWFLRGDIQEMARSLKHALVLDPNIPEALLFFSAALGFAGRESTVEVARLLAIDPLTPFNLIAPAWVHLSQGRFSQAEEVCRRWYGDERDNPLAALIFGDVLARTGGTEEAKAVFEQLAQRLPEKNVGRLALFLAHALDGDKAEALRAVTPTLMEWVRWDPELSWEMATGYALINEKQKAIDWLETATRVGFINYPFLSQYDPLLENLRQEKRFLALMEDVRLRWERFEV